MGECASFSATVQVTVSHILCEHAGTPGSWVSVDRLNFLCLRRKNLLNKSSLTSLVFLSCVYFVFTKSLCEARVYDLPSQSLPLNVPSQQGWGRCDVLASVFDGIIGTVTDCIVFLRPIASYEPCTWQGPLFVNTHLQNQTESILPHREQTFSVTSVSSEGTIGMCVRALLRSSDSLHPSSHPNKSQGINCLNTVIFRICQEKDQTKNLVLERSKGSRKPPTSMRNK